MTKQIVQALSGKKVVKSAATNSRIVQNTEASDAARIADDRLNERLAWLRSLRYNRLYDDITVAASEMLQWAMQAPPENSNNSFRKFTATSGLGAKITVAMKAFIPDFGERANMLINYRNFDRPYFGSVESLLFRKSYLLNRLVEYPEFVNDATPEQKTAVEILQNFDALVPFFLYPNNSSYPSERGHLKLIKD